MAPKKYDPLIPPWTAMRFAVAGVCLAFLKIWFAGGVNHWAPDMSGKTVLVTGANTGIGLPTADEMVRLGATVVMAGRDARRIGDAVASVNAKGYKGMAVAGLVDLSSLASVSAFAKRLLGELTRLDALILNAGVMIPPPTNTSDGLELQWGTNHVGHHLLTTTLLPLVKSTASSRVIVVSSLAAMTGSVEATLADPAWARRPYSAVQAYADSKMANVLFASELQRRLGGGSGPESPLAFSLHPGSIDTELARHVSAMPYLKPLFYPLVYLFLKTPTAGAQTQLYLSLAPEARVRPFAGRYFSDCACIDEPGSLSLLEKAWHITPFLITNPRLRDAELAGRLWRETEGLIAAKTGKASS
jgi:retinol dehydrogenase-12